MTLVNVHSVFSNTSRGSNGCPTICLDDKEAFFNNFIWNKDKNGNDNITGKSSGTVDIIRQDPEREPMGGSPAPSATP